MSRTLQALIVATTVLAGANSTLAAEPIPAPTPANSSTIAPEELAEVTVTAHRLELEKRVSKFVAQIAATENGAEGLARWQVPPVCPLVSGLPHKDGEFILERLSEIARTAGVPISDDEHCHPNLYILVTDQPEDLLRSMEQRNRAFTFGYDYSMYPPQETSPTSVNEFISASRPVKVWYNTQQKDMWGNPATYCPIDEYGDYVRCMQGTAGGSHLRISAMWTMWTAFVIVDRNRLNEVKLGQLADYVSMCAFAKLKPDAQLGDAPTILTLFDRKPGAAPTGITEWDQTFLKSLYATDQISKTQRSAIARQMVHDIAH